jgi:hypothetical protein
MVARALVVTSFVACALGLAVPSSFAQSPPPSADDAAANEARTQYNAGTKAFADQRYAEAALAFEAAAALKPSSVALYTAALSWDRMNAPDRAADDYARSVALPGLAPDKLQQARDRLAQLETMLGAVAVTGPDGARVQLDSNTERAVPVTLHGTVGVHTLAVRSPSGEIDQRRVVLERGKTAPLDLSPAPSPAPVPTTSSQAAPPPPEPPPPVAEAPASDWKKPVGFAVVGTGGALILAGIVLGIEADGARDAYNASPTRTAYNHASQMQTWTNVAFIAGGVLAAAGIALVVWPHPKHAEPASAGLLVVPNGVVGSF